MKLKVEEYLKKLKLKMRKLDRTFPKWFLQISKLHRRCKSRCADSTTRVVWPQNAVAKVDRTSMKTYVSKCENIAKHVWLQHPGCNFVWENEKRCADFTTRCRRNKTRVAKVARASAKICGPTKRDDCKNHDGQKKWTI